MLCHKTTVAWLELSFTDAAGAARSLTVTPGHRFLNEHGRFEMIEDIAHRAGRIIDQDGRMLAFTAKRVTHGAATAGLYEQATGMLSPEAGGLALQAQPVEGWATYNFEVEGLDTSIAGRRGTCEPTECCGGDAFLTRRALTGGVRGLRAGYGDVIPIGVTGT